MDTISILRIIFRNQINESVDYQRSQVNETLQDEVYEYINWKINEINE